MVLNSFSSVSALPSKKEGFKLQRSASVGMHLDAKLRFGAIEAQLKQKEEDAKLAATIGRELLEKNDQLAADLAELKGRVRECACACVRAHFLCENV